MADPLRVFIAAASADARSALARRLADDDRWRVVSDPAMADVVLASVDEWERVRATTAAPRPRPRESLVEGLTPREIEVLRLVADGLHNREIAERLGVTEHTVKFHLAAVFGKLGASTRTEAVRKGVGVGVLEI